MRILKIIITAFMGCLITGLLYAAAPMVWHFNQRVERIEQGRYYIGNVAYVVSPKVRVFIAPDGKQAESNLVRASISDVRTGDIVTIQEQGASIQVFTISR